MTENKLPQIAGAENAPGVGRRLMSVDALRGFDMIWILGVDSVAVALHRMYQNPVVGYLAYELDHAEWDGLHLYDLIFPTFVFIVGVSLVLSLDKTIATKGRGEAVKRIFRRSILLFLFGVIYNGGFAHAWPQVRLAGVLQRIAFGYFFSGLFYCYLKPRTMAAICAGLLLGYWGLLGLVPVRDIALTRMSLANAALKAGDPGTARLFIRGRGGNPQMQAAARKYFYATTAYTTGKYEQGFNLTNQIDFQYLPGSKYDTFYDPEGYLSTLPAVATCLLGVFAGMLLRNRNVADEHKVGWLIVCGIGAILLGWLWGIEFPVVKKIWTLSYVLVAAGYGALMLGLFYWFIDIRGHQGWCQPFVWVGMNAITLYMLSSIGVFDNIALKLCEGNVRIFFENHVAQGSGDLVVTAAGLGMAVWLAEFMYKRKIFLRL